MSIRWCKNCGEAAAEEFSDFCSDICAREYVRKKLKRTCKTCGADFYVRRGAERWTCDKCKYKASVEGLKAPKKKEPPAPKYSIDDVIAEQKRIYEETGKWITYGQIVSRKG